MNAQQSWSPYAGSSSIILAAVLLIITGVLLSFAFRFHHPKQVKRPGLFLGIALVLMWLLAVTTWVIAVAAYGLAIYQQKGPSTTPPNYTAPVTLTLLLVAFIVIVFLARRSGFWVAVGSAIVGTIAAPLIFELPFDLIVMGHTYPPDPGSLFTLLFFLPLFLVEIASFALLTFSPVMKLSKYTLFALAGMFVIFAVWAVFGFAYPLAPLPIALNMISKVLAFAAAVSLFLPPETSTWFAQKEVPTQQQFTGVIPAEIAPSREPLGPLSETERAETSGEMPVPSPRKISRRAVMIGLAAGGLVVAGGGLSWWLLRRRAYLTYTGHTDWVYDVAWSPDGTRLASCSKDTTVQIWDATAGNRIFTYRGHTADVFTAAWSPDGRRIASCSQDTTAQVWDAVDGGHVFTYRGHRDAVVMVAWSPDSKRLASGGGNLDFGTNKPSDDTVQIWDVADGSHVFTYRGHTNGVQAVVWSPDGTRIASASLDNTVQVWDATDGGHVLTYRGHTDHVLNLAWSPDGTYLASVGTDKTVQIWRAADGGHVFTYTGHTDWVFGVAWSPDSRRIASSSSDKTAQVWDAVDGGHVFVYNGHTDAVITTAWSPDGTRIASSSFDTTVQIWSPG
jgi:hypothetical protein